MDVDTSCWEGRGGFFLLCLTRVFVCFSLSSISLLRAKKKDSWAGLVKRITEAV